MAFYWRSSLPIARRVTCKKAPKPFLAPIMPLHAQAPRLLFAFQATSMPALRLPGHINGFLLALFAFQATSMAFSSLPFARRETAPKPFWHPSFPPPRHQGHIHSFSAPSRPNPQNPFGTNTPRHQGHIHSFSSPSRPHHWLFTSVQACRLPGVKRPQNPFGTHHAPARPGTKAISIAFLRLPGHINGFLLAFKPALRLPGHINGFLLAFKPAVCQA